MYLFKIFLVLIISAFAIGFDGLFADGFTPSNWGEAINHVSDRVRSAHSSAGGNVDLSALENLTEEQREKLFMVQIDDPERKANDPRRETVYELEMFKEEIKRRDFSSSRKKEIIEEVDGKIKGYNRRIEKGLYRWGYIRYDNCLSGCNHATELMKMQCLNSEIDERQECADMSIVNPMKLKCLYDMSETKKSCTEESSWSYQVCQSKCFN